MDKLQFPILTCPPRYPISTQVKLVTALACVTNFKIDFTAGTRDDIDREFDTRNPLPMQTTINEGGGRGVRRRDPVVEWRARVADEMWAAYQAELGRRVGRQPQLLET